MQYVSFSPEKQFPDVETGQKKKKATSSYDKKLYQFQDISSSTSLETCKFSSKKWKYFFASSPIVRGLI